MPQPSSKKVSRADALLWAVEAEECRRSLKTFLKSMYWQILRNAVISEMEERGDTGGDSG